MFLMYNSFQSFYLFLFACMHCPKYAAFIYRITVSEFKHSINSQFYSTSLGIHIFVCPHCIPRAIFHQSPKALWLWVNISPYISIIMHSMESFRYFPAASPPIPNKHEKLLLPTLLNNNISCINNDVNILTFAPTFV